MMTKTRSNRATGAPRALPPALRRTYTTLSRQSLEDAFGALAQVRDSLDARSARRQLMQLRLRLLRAGLDDMLQPAPPPAPAPSPEPEPAPPPPPPEPEPTPEPVPEPEPEIIPPPARKQNRTTMMKMDESAMAALFSQLGDDEDEAAPADPKSQPDQKGGQ